MFAQLKKYGRKSPYIGINRTPFLINATGYILYIWPKVKVPGHGEKFLNIIEQPVQAGGYHPRTASSKFF